MNVSSIWNDPTGSNNLYVQLEKRIQNETEFLSTLNIQRSNSAQDAAQAALVDFVITRLFWGVEDGIFVA